MVLPWSLWRCRHRRGLAAATGDPGPVAQRREKRTAAISPNTTTMAALQIREPLM
jgi:hypothetical protein